MANDKKKPAPSVLASGSASKKPRKDITAANKARRAAKCERLAKDPKKIASTKRRAEASKARRQARKHEYYRRQEAARLLAEAQKQAAKKKKEQAVPAAIVKQVAEGSRDEKAIAAQHDQPASLAEESAA